MLSARVYTDMFVTNTDTVAGRETIETIGLVRGNTVRARNIGRDFTQGIRNITGGELKGYTTLMSEAREEAVERMVAHAEELGADAVVNVRFITAEVTQGAAEILAYGTAVRLSPGEELASEATAGTEADSDIAGGDVGPSESAA
jgi:uncharacterized protein YbjQ (UPF0145 family)